MLKLKVENIGPIESAEIELSKITAVIGPNASGKTFLSLLLLSIADMFQSPMPHQDIKNDETYKELIELFDKNKGNTIFTLKISQFAPMLEQQLSATFKKSLMSNFGVALDKIIKFDKNNASEQSVVSVFDDNQEIIFNFTQQDITCNFSIKNDFEIRINQTEEPSSPRPFSYSTINGREIILHTSSNVNSMQRINLISLNIKSLIIPEYFRYGKFKFLPTERGLIISILNVLTSWFINAYGVQMLALQLGITPQVQIDRASVGRFISDFMMQVSVSDQNIKSRLPQKTRDLSFKVKKPLSLEITEGEHPVPPGLLSSGYSQQIPIVFFQNSPLIIEEPELNLHAGAQLDIADFLCNIKQNIFLTTHSDVFLVQLAINSKKVKKELKIYFLYNGKIKEIKVMKNGDIEEIDTISYALNKQAKELTA